MVRKSRYLFILSVTAYFITHEKVNYIVLAVVVPMPPRAI